MNMNNQELKVFTIVLVVATIIITLMGGTLAYWSWQSEEAQKTNVTFTVASNFSCSADGGGNITNNDVMIAPASCTNSTHAIKREVKVNINKNGASNIYLDMYLNVNSIGTGLSNSQNFRYALTTSSTSCSDGVVAQGNFSGATTDTHIGLFKDKQYTQTVQNDTYYLWVWLDKQEASVSTQNQAFDLSLNGSCTDQAPSPIYASWGEEVDRFAQVNFSQTSVENGTDGLYLFGPTAADTNPVYYYRGNVSNNNVLFGGFCWKIVRTTDTGGTKLIYNGAPTSGSCVNTTGDATQLSETTAFNSYDNSPANVGYMYGTRYTSSSRSSSSLTTSYKYGNSFTYSDGTYTLKDTIDSSGTWRSDYVALNNNHYTCFNTTGTCNSLYYIYYTNTSYAYYITLTNGKSVENALNEMLTSSSNTTNSTIKGVLDTWYQNNLSSYSTYLEDTVWCNDRSISSLNGWNPNGGDTTKNLLFSAYERLYNTYSPSLTCSKNDSFTVSSSNGNKKLTYPIGLLTTDEIMMAGGDRRNNNSYYLYTNKSFWAGSPNSFNASGARGFYVALPGPLMNGNVGDNYGVRPAISLKPGVIWSGSGTSSAPYTVSLS